MVGGGTEDGQIEARRMNKRLMKNEWAMNER